MSTKKTEIKMEDSGGLFASMEMDLGDNHEEEVVEETTDDEVEELSDEEAAERAAQAEEEEDEDSSETSDESNEEDSEEETEQSDDLESDEEETSYSTFMESLSEAGVLSPETDKEYTDDSEGVQELIEDTVKQEVEKWKSGLGEEALKALEWAEKGGQIKDLVELENSIDYTNIDLEEESNFQYLVADALLLDGYEEEDIKEMVEEYRDAGTLEKHAKRAHKKLVKSQETQREAAKKRLEQEHQAKLDQIESDRADIHKTVSGLREVSGIALSKKEAEELADYITKPVKKGKTQFEMDDDVEARYLLAYLKKNKIDLSKIQKKATTKATIKFKKGMSKGTKDPLAKRKGGSRPQGPKDADKIFIPNMF
jgi:hypothetical protein